jgi:hypothetical protein
MTGPARFQAYWEAIRQHVRRLPDQADDGECGLTQRVWRSRGTCRGWPRSSRRCRAHAWTEYEAAVRAEICPGCSGQDGQGRCALREKADCAPFAYLPLVLEAVESVNERFFA